MTARVFMTAFRLRCFPNYSSSYPGGTGFAWRRAVDFMEQDDNDRWILGQYGEPFPKGHPKHGYIPIIWRQIVVTDVTRKFPIDVCCPTRMPRFYPSIELSHVGLGSVT